MMRVDWLFRMFGFEVWVDRRRLNSRAFIAKDDGTDVVLAFGRWRVIASRLSKAKPRAAHDGA